MSGVFSREAVGSYASSGGAAQGSSRTPHSLLLPHKFWSIENGLSKLIGIGIFFSFAYSISSSRDHFQSRTGAKTSKCGFNALIDTSKRTWSFPFPVHPCATATAFSCSATSTSFLAISGLDSADTNGYFPSYNVCA